MQTVQEEQDLFKQQVIVGKQKLEEDDVLEVSVGPKTVMTHMEVMTADVMEVSPSKHVKSSF